MVFIYSSSYGGRPLRLKYIVPILYLKMHPNRLKTRGPYIKTYTGLGTVDRLNIWLCVPLHINKKIRSENMLRFETLGA